MFVFNVVSFDGERLQIPVDIVSRLEIEDDGTEKGMVLGCLDKTLDPEDLFKLIWPDKESRRDGFHPSISESIQDVGFAEGFYKYYLKTGKWRKKRMERIRIDDFKCARCGSEKNLHVHHLNYERLGNENVQEDLVTLCNKCHAEIHGKETQPTTKSTTVQKEML